MRKTHILSKLLHLGLSKLKLGKTLIYEPLYDNVKPNCGKKANLC